MYEDWQKKVCFLFHVLTYATSEMLLSDVQYIWRLFPSMRMLLWFQWQVFEQGVSVQGSGQTSFGCIQEGME